MTDYTKDYGEYLKVIDKDAGTLIGIFKIETGVLSTIHNVKTVTDDDYLAYMSELDAALNNQE